MDNLYFAIESGPVLEMARDHIRGTQALNKRNGALLTELGVERFWPSIMDGTVSAVQWSGKPHEDFTKADSKGRSRPKKGTVWAARFAEQVGHDRRGYDIANALGVPTTLRYKSSNSDGMTGISGGFSSGVGFLYCSEDGPYALYLPDVAGRVAKYEADGYTIDDECKNFKPEFDGCRRILKQEWDFIVAKFELEAAKEAA